jgi:hypothetical protein
LKREEPPQFRRSSWDEWVCNAGVDLVWVGQQPVSIPRHPLPSDTSYLFSPFRGWFDYLAHELRQANQGLSAAMVKWAGWAFSLLGLRETIVLGAEPVSTNLYGPSDTDSLLEAARLASNLYRRRFVAIRNLTQDHHRELMHSLGSLGFVALPARVIYEFDAPTEQGSSNPADVRSLRRPSHLTRDLRLLKNSGLRVGRPAVIDEFQAERLRALYERIYIKKHSPLNAQYTANFFSGVINEGLMELLVLESEDDWLGFALIYKRGMVATVPALGYGETCEGMGGYRLVFAAIYEQTVGQGVHLNYSSGAGDFKRKRGGQPVLEYIMLRTPLASRYRGRLLRWLADRLSRIRVEDLIRRGA